MPVELTRDERVLVASAFLDAQNKLLREARATVNTELRFSIIGDMEALARASEKILGTISKEGT